ncbi:MAG: MBL fold metallo-hydrolase [Phycisphaerales bacterium]|nr:MBL fold metallo-hydrolase [Phycisphaerales bacterium]
MSSAYAWWLLRAGAFRLDGGGMFGLVPRTMWSRLAPPDDTNRIRLQTNCLLLRGEAGTLLIETGFGGKWTEKERAIYDLEQRTVVDALREVGVEPQAIDHVVVTHLHFDHAAGLTVNDRSGKPVPTFPNADIVVQRQEWEDALANKSTMTRTYLRTHLDPVADRVRLIEGDAEALPGIRVGPMVGHTWGQQAVRFDDATGVVCFPGDVLPTIHHAGAAFNMAYDMLPYRNMLSKRSLLDRAADEAWRLVLDHEPDRPVVRVERDPERRERHRLVPVAEVPSPPAPPASSAAGPSMD